MSYRILAHEDRVIKTLDDLPDRENKVETIISKLEKNPFPGEGRGNISKLRNLGCYRLHLGQEYTAMYKIDKNKNKVRVLDLLTREKAEKRYGESGRFNVKYQP